MIVAVVHGSTTVTVNRIFYRSPDGVKVEGEPLLLAMVTVLESFTA